MTEVFVYTVVASIAVVLGAIAGRVFAMEAENRLMSILAATYVSAGVGLMSAIPTGSLLTLAAQMLNGDSSTWFDALDVAGMALLWGTAGGAAGGLVIGIVIAAYKTVQAAMEMLR